MDLCIASAVIGFRRDKTPFLQITFTRPISGPQSQYEILQRLALAEKDTGSNTYAIEDCILQVYPNGAAEMSMNDFEVRARHVMKHLTHDPEEKDLSVCGNATHFQEPPSSL
jgi:hypothetical protein